MLGFQGAEKCFLGTKDLYGAGWMLGEIVEATSMADQPCTDQFTDESSQIGCNGIHTIAEILRQLCPVFGDGNHLITEVVDVVDILLGNFTAHRNLSSDLDSRFKIFWEDGGEGC